MAQPAAKQGDQVIASDTHIVLVPSASGSAPTPLLHPFSGQLNGGLSPNVMILGRQSAVVGSTATNQPPHFPTSPGTSFTVPPSNMGVVLQGSTTVRINGQPAARNNDSVQTCADPVPNTSGKVIAQGTVMIGG